MSTRSPLATKPTSPWAPSTGIATARCFPLKLGRERVGEADAQVGGRDLLAGEDVGDGDAPVEVRGIGDRADLEVVLRQSVAAWKSCFSAMTVPDVPFGMRFFATSTGSARSSR